MKWELSTEVWGNILGVTDRAIRKWESGENPIPGPVAAFCRVLLMLTDPWQRKVVNFLYGEPIL